MISLQCLLLIVIARSLFLMGRASSVILSMLLSDSLFLALVVILLFRLRTFRGSVLLNVLLLFKLAIILVRPLLLFWFHRVATFLLLHPNGIQIPVIIGARFLVLLLLLPPLALMAILV